MIKYLGYRIIKNELDMPFVYGIGRFDDGRKLYVKIPMTRDLIEDVGEEWIDKYAMDEVLKMRPEDIEGG